ncbi:MAG TPA: toxin-antitoxin system YwqK family antitoxin [Sunxiuqinia sp.]|nr:toxin-antitoxin system YwqK family antitoxin [Sunxiuqinia sp.]
MQKVLSLAFFILISLTGFAQSKNNQFDSQGRKQGLWEKRLPNGNLIYQGTFKNDKPVGEFKRYHANGIIKAKLIYTEGSDTIAAELFDSKGKLMAKGHYIGHTKDGHWKYYKQGQLISEENYDQGVKNGVSKTYYPTGELFEETHWKNNQKSGIYRAFFKTGKPYMECQMTDGKRNGTCKVYYENGQLELDGYYWMGLRDSNWIYTKDNGEYAYTLTYNKGSLQNPEVRDSVQALQMNDLEKKKGTLVDPEKFMEDPFQYMQKNKMIRR